MSTNDLFDCAQLCGKVTFAICKVAQYLDNTGLEMVKTRNCERIDSALQLRPLSMHIRGSRTCIVEVAELASII